MVATGRSFDPTGGDTLPASEIDTVVARRKEIADGVVHIVLRHSANEEFPAWQPGAHIDVALENGLVRQYSLCGDPTDLSQLEIAVLREPFGRGGSAYVHDKLTEGHHVTIRVPRCHFPLVDASEYIFIAGGIGITPILPMIQKVTRSNVPWRLIYGGRSHSSMAFIEDLARFGDRVHIRPQDEVGLLDLATELGPPRHDVAVYSCGPEGLLQAVANQCRDWPPGCLHVERFAPKTQPDQPKTGTFELELARSDRTLTVAADRSIVDVMDDAGIEVPVSCREGTCGTCETTVLAGTPDHRDSILNDAEREANDVMFICVSRSCTPTLRIDR